MTDNTIIRMYTSTPSFDVIRYLMDFYGNFEKYITSDLVSRVASLIVKDGGNVKELEEFASKLPEELKKTLYIELIRLCAPIELIEKYDTNKRWKLSNIEIIFRDVIQSDSDLDKIKHVLDHLKSKLEGRTFSSSLTHDMVSYLAYGHRVCYIKKVEYLLKSPISLGVNAIKIILSTSLDAYTQSIVHNLYEHLRNDDDLRERVSKHFWENVHLPNLSYDNFVMMVDLFDSDLDNLFLSIRSQYYDILCRYVYKLEGVVPLKRALNNDNINFIGHCEIKKHLFILRMDSLGKWVKYQFTGMPTFTKIKNFFKKGLEKIDISYILNTNILNRRSNV